MRNWSSPWSILIAEGLACIGIERVTPDRKSLMASLPFG
jgi:hypothetical protein